MKLTTGLENFEGPFFRFSWDRQNLLVDPTPVERFVSQLGTWPAATRVFLPTTKGGREERPCERGCLGVRLDVASHADIREFKQITTAGPDTAAGSKFPQKWDTAHARRLHPAVAWNLTTWVWMFCGTGCYVWFISLSWPFSTDISAFCEFHWILYPLKSV